MISRFLKRVGLLFDEPLESQFKDEFSKRSLEIVRVALLLAIVLYAAFGVLDYWIVPESKKFTWFVRYAIVCPYVAFVLLLTFFPFFQKNMQWILVLTGIFLGAGIVSFIAVANPGELGFSFYYAGLMLVIMWVYALCRLRFMAATITSLLITAMYEFVTIYAQSALSSVESITIFANNNFFFLSANIIGMFAGFTIEYYIRSDFMQQQNLEQERKKSEKLLLNVLPQAIAERLKKEETTIAEAFPHATVLFADIVGFTRLAQSVSPANLVRMLNQIFSLMDRLAEKYDLEKIKTIGDAYLAVGGVPIEDPAHALKVANFALELRDNIRKIKRKKTGEAVEMRIGIHSGPVVAGVIGIKKFAYDLWGDTVNTAARMESHGLANQIQVTASTHELLARDFIFSPARNIEVKGKGVITTYILESCRD